MKNEKNSVKTKEMIFEAAVKLFSEKGYHGTSMRDLAKEVGLNESSIYNHFSGKSDIFKTILDYQNELFMKAVESLNEVKLETEGFDDPVEIWKRGTIHFIKNMPPLSEKISQIIVNEMFLNKQCREYVLETMFPSQKKLTEDLLTVLYEKGLIKDCNIGETAERYIYMLYGLDIEKKLLLLEGKSIEETSLKLLKHIQNFIENLKI